jgi:hypothetical protein
MAVVLVKAGDTLNVRDGPGADAQILARIPPDADDVVATSRRQSNGRTLWLEVRHQGKTGWASADFLTRYIEAAALAKDEEVSALINGVGRALKERKGLEQWTSPRGLHLAVNWWNPVMRFENDAVKEIFDDTASRSWGSRDGSGQPIEGSFSSVVLPPLDDVFGDEDVNVAYGEILTANTTGQVKLPAELAGFPVVSLHDPGDDLDLEGMDWRTWALGLDFTDEGPKLVFLVQYHWEI